MSGSAFDEYLAGIDARAVPTVTALAEAVTRAYDGFDSAVKYRLLMYALNQDWRHWVVSVGTSSKLVSLRFLYGVLMSDPRGVLRPGSSTLMTWDFAFGAEVDADAVGGYVREAAELYPTYRADAKAIAAKARADAEARKAGKASRR